MSRDRFTLSTAAAWLLALCLSLVSSLPAQTSKPSAADEAGKMTGQTRLLVIRSLQSERVYARVMFPQGDKGLKLKNGVITPSEMAVAQLVAELGPAARPGDRCVISDVQIKDKSIIIELNGGPKKHQKWYQHIEVVGTGGATPIPGGTSPQSLDAHGSAVTIEFDRFVPELTGDQVRGMLSPVLDFTALTPAEAYEKTLSPKAQEAIKNHQVLVGMDKEMVMYSKGRPPHKIRDKDDKGEDYEEWIYGNPPEQVEFVRFKGNEVAQLEIMTVDGKKVVRTEKEVDLKSKEAELAQQKPAAKPQNAPTLRRPGEEPEFPTGPSSRRSPSSGTAPPSTSSPYPDAGGNNPPPGLPPISPTDPPPHVLPSL